MDIGTAVKCQRCTTKFYMYYDTHGIEWGSVGGMCPHCNAYVAARIKKELIEFYPPRESYEVGQTISPVAYHAG
jgi:hypothetical protein